MKKLMIVSASIVLFALAGFAYYSFVGCASGTCALTSSPYTSTIMGGAVGLFLGLSVSDRKR